MSQTRTNSTDTPVTLPFVGTTPYGRRSWSGLLQFSLVGIPLKATFSPSGHKASA